MRLLLSVVVYYLLCFVIAELHVIRKEFLEGQQDVLNQCRQHLGQPPVEPVEYLDWQSYCQRRGFAHRAQCPVCGQPLICTDAFPPGGIPPPLEKAVTLTA